MRACIAAFLVLVALAAPAAAKDYFLTIGGGYARTGNQASLEKNALYSQRVLREAGVALARQAVLVPMAQTEASYSGDRVDWRRR